MLAQLARLQGRGKKHCSGIMTRTVALPLAVLVDLRQHFILVKNYMTVSGLRTEYSVY